MAHRIVTVHAAREHRDRGPMPRERGPVRTTINPESTALWHRPTRAPRRCPRDTAQIVQRGRARFECGADLQPRIALPDGMDRSLRNVRRSVRDSQTGDVERRAPALTRGGGPARG
jgi:hypothetical protein